MCTKEKAGLFGQMIEQHALHVFQSKSPFKSRYIQEHFSELKISISVPQVPKRQDFQTAVLEKPLKYFEIRQLEEQ